MRARVYLETTIFSYLAARLSRDLIVAAHQQLTEEWWTTRRDGFELFASELVYREAAAGDQAVAKKRLGLIEPVSLLVMDEAAFALAEQFLARQIVPRKVAEDALHVAVSAVNGMDYLLTWNCKHIANARLFRRMGEVCLGEGYELPVICTPEELMGE